MSSTLESEASERLKTRADIQKQLGKAKEALGDSPPKNPKGGPKGGAGTG